jgi:hypothetical protein
MATIGIRQTHDLEHRLSPVFRPGRTTLVQLELAANHQRDQLGGSRLVDPASGLPAAIFQNSNAIGDAEHFL